MMPATALLVSLLVLTSSGSGYASPFATREEQEAYLEKYAYMGSKSPDRRFASLTDPDKMFEMAVMKFQMMAGINETGVVDEETIKMMEMPRCGLEDEIGMSLVTKRRRRRRYAIHGSRWSNTRLTYRINNYTPDLPQQVTDSEIQAAFKQWSDVSPLTFVKVTDQRQIVDFEINFAARKHGDFNDFDGPGNVLAHAYFPTNAPIGGDAHFDEDEQWSSKSNSGTNLLQVAIHEFGHSLGLEHSMVQDAIMAPYYRGYKPNVQLHPDDIAGIRCIYRSMNLQVEPTKQSSTTPISPLSSTKRMPPSDHAICRDPTVDAIFAVEEDVYIFKGAEYYMGRRLDFLSPARPIGADWPGLPDNITTAVYLEGSILFFKGHQFWRFNNARQPQGDNPQNISTVFQGLPNKTDAAFVWSGNSMLYFISGKDYYRVSKGRWSTNIYQVDFGYPQPLRAWEGLPSKIDVAFNYTNGRTYFVSGIDFYRYNDVSFKVDPGYPQPTATYWLGCSDRMESGIKTPEEDMMQREFMAGGDQFMGMAGGDQLIEANQTTTPNGVGLPTHSVLLSTITVFAAFLLFP